MPVPDLSTVRVLVADDNRDTATSLALLLEAAGYTVVGAAHEGAAALDAIQRLRPSVAILDIVLPDLDGYQIAKQVRLMDPPRPRLVAVSGLGRTCDRLDALQAGFHAHFSKPVDWPRLNELLVAYAANPDLSPRSRPLD
jgi:CheY-like chemotaxis protein